MNINVCAGMTTRSSRQALDETVFIVLNVLGIAFKLIHRDAISHQNSTNGSPHSATGKMWIMLKSNK